jgi:hypothetical protein
LYAIHAIAGSGNTPKNIPSADYDRDLHAFIVDLFDFFGIFGKSAGSIPY